MITDKKLPERYPENSQGDFYIENEACLACGSTEGEAPDLIEHSQKEYGHCYFKKQPQTDDEIDRAINAIHVSCLGGLRYGGKDEKILKRLYEIGLDNLCDQKPAGNYKTIIRNKVTFNYSGTIIELSDNIKSQVVMRYPQLVSKILNYITNNKDYFEFIYRWTDRLTGTIHKCNFQSNGQCRIDLIKEKDGDLISLIADSLYIDVILQNDKNATEINWFDMDGTPKPFEHKYTSLNK